MNNNNTSSNFNNGNMPRQPLLPSSKQKPETQELIGRGKPTVAKPATSASETKWAVVQVTGFGGWGLG